MYVFCTHVSIGHFWWFYRIPFLERVRWTMFLFVIWKCHGFNKTDLNLQEGKCNYILMIQVKINYFQQWTGRSRPLLFLPACKKGWTICGELMHTILNCYLQIFATERIDHDFCLNCKKLLTFFAIIQLLFTLYLFLEH